MEQNKTYHEQKSIEYIKNLRSYLADMPTYVTTYFRGIEHRTQPRTRLAYAIDLKVFFDWLKASNPIFAKKDIAAFSLDDLSSLETFDIEEYMDYLKLRDTDEGVEISNQEISIKRKMSALRGLYAYLYKNQMISNNPTARIDMPKIHEKAITRLDANEVVGFLDVVDKGPENMSSQQAVFHDKTKVRDLALLTLMLGTGIRVTECVGLDINDVDIDNSRIKVTRKGGYESYVYYGNEVEAALLPYLTERKAVENIASGSEAALFLSGQKKRLCVRSVEKLVKKYAGYITTVKHITPHKLRSTYGTSLYRETGDIYLVADVLGHKDVNTTKKHYAALDEDRKRSARNVVKLRED